MSACTTQATDQPSQAWSARSGQVWIDGLIRVRSHGQSCQFVIGDVVIIERPVHRDDRNPRSCPHREHPGAASRRASSSSCWAVDDDEDMAERHRPAGVVERDRPRPPIAAIDMGHPVRLTVIVDDVARPKTIGVDRGHRAVCVAIRRDAHPDTVTRPKPHRAPQRHAFMTRSWTWRQGDVIGESPCSASAGRIATDWIASRDAPERRHRTTNAGAGHRAPNGMSVSMCGRVAT